LEDKLEKWYLNLNIRGFWRKNINH
jgi:hypothetical protein